MKLIFYPCILFFLFAYCNFFGAQPTSNNCPCLECIADSASSKYSVRGPLQAYTLADSFSQLVVGNEWIYEFAVISEDIGGSGSACSILTFQVLKSTGTMAVIKGSENNLLSFDTLYLTNDSITRSLGTSNDISPVLLGFRKSIYPCFKLDDNSGYIYGTNSGGELSYYISYIGLVYVYEPISGNSEAWYKLQSFNGIPISSRDLFECIAKLEYYNNNPDSIITSSLNETSPAKLFEGVIFPFDLRSGFAFWNQSCPKTPSLSIVQKKS